jgi:hypothetical protein
MIAALTVSAAINLLVAFGVMSGPYISLGLFVAAVGALAAQARGRRRENPKNESGDQSDAPSVPVGEPEGKALTAVWLAILLGWAATLAYGVFWAG